MTNGEKFKSEFGIYATELWVMPEEDFLKWLKVERTHAYVIIDEDGNMECSNCGSGNCFDNYCGHCGAKLVGERKDEVEDERV